MYPSKAAQKRDLDKLSKEYETQERVIKNVMLEAAPTQEERNEEWQADYWAMPMNLFQWKPKHYDIATKYDPEAATIINELYEARLVIKEAEIAPKAVTVADTTTKVSEYLIAQNDAAEYEALKNQMVEAGITINKKTKTITINGMSVSVNPVFVMGNVVCDHVRFTYSVDGKRIKGSIVKAAIEEALKVTEAA